MIAKLILTILSLALTCFVASPGTANAQEKKPNIVVIWGGDAAMISGYLGSNSRFDKAVAKFALTYAEQNERDYKTLLKAIREGRIQTLEE
jgi:hypothetical protein